MIGEFNDPPLVMNKTNQYGRESHENHYELITTNNHPQRLQQWPITHSSKMHMEQFS